MPPRRCPTGKIKHFNEAWADIAAAEQSEKFGSTYSTYQCVCGWWHTFDRSKKHAKEQQREPRTARRRRAARGEPSPLQALREKQQRDRKRLKRLRYNTRKALPLMVWEDDGGAFIHPSES
jgi:hypothetical protein